MAERADTVIIGGGVGGTALGALLASAGQRVILFEKNTIIGGRCASYIRDEFIVDVGVHLFGMCDKGPLGEVCRRAGEPEAIKWVLARTHLMASGSPARLHTSPSGPLSHMPNRWTPTSTMNSSLI